MPIVPLGTQPKPAVYEVTALTDVGAALGVLPAGEGFSPTTQGFQSALDPYNNYPNGTLIIVRAAAPGSYLFMVQQGALNKVAVLIGVLSGGASTLSGAALKYVVYPAGASFNNPPTGVYTTIAAALTAANVTDANLGNRVPIIVAPGPYSESVTLRDGIDIIGLGSASETGGSGVTITGDGVSPTFTITEGSSVGLQNIRVLGNGQNCCFFPNLESVTRLTVKDCVFSTATTAFEGGGVDTEVQIDLRDSSVTGTIRAFDINNVSTGYLAARGSQISGETRIIEGLLRDSVVGPVVWDINLIVSGSKIDSLNGGALEIEDSSVTAGAALTATSICRRSSFNGTVSFAAAAGNSLIEDCSILTGAGDGVTVGAGHTVTFVASTIRPFTGVAISGLGSAVIVGGLAGGGTVTLPAANVTAVSAQISRLEVDVAASAAPGTVWPASNPDRVRVTSAGVTNLVQLPAANTQVPGRELMIRNVDAANSFTLTVAALSGDSLFDGMASGNIIIAPGDYRRVICRRSGSWEVN